MNTQRPTEAIRVLAQTDPITGAATHTSGWVDMGLRNAVLAIIQTGVIGTSVDAKIEQATDSSGTGAKDITGKAITQLTAGAEIAKIEVYSDDLDLDNSFNHVRLSVTTVGAATASSGSILSYQERYNPDTESSEVKENVT